MTSTASVILPLFSGSGWIVAAGLLSWMRRGYRALKHVDGQLRNNGGSSVKDAIDRIESRQIRFEKQIKKDRKRDRKRITALEDQCLESSRATSANSTAR